MYQIGSLGSYSTDKFTGDTVKVTFYDLVRVGEFRPLVVVHRNYAHAEVRAKYLMSKGQVVARNGVR